MSTVHEQPSEVCAKAINEVSLSLKNTIHKLLILEFKKKVSEDF